MPIYDVENQTSLKSRIVKSVEIRRSNQPNSCVMKFTGPSQFSKMHRFEILATEDLAYPLQRFLAQCSTVSGSCQPEQRMIKDVIVNIARQQS